MRLGETGQHYSNPGAQLEAWSRQLWALAPLAAGGGIVPRAEELAIGLDHGTNPDHEEFWGWPVDGDQRFVEMAVIGFTLGLCPQLLWEPLDQPARERVTRWLNTINKHRIPANNWLFFRVMVNLGLERLGMEASFEQVEKDLEAMDACYLGDGWYEDGPGGGLDHYNGFAIHFYDLFVTTLYADRLAHRRQQTIERAEKFAADFVNWFDTNGACIGYGRSMIYRCAMAAFWSAVAFAGIDSIPVELSRGIISRHIRWWLDKPILDSRGILTLGYGYPNLYMCETYNSPGSPAWALKTFLVLALAEDHPFWQAEEGELPDTPAPRIQTNGKMLARRQEDGQAVLITSGYRHKMEFGAFADKYSRLVYSSRHGYSIARSNHSLGAMSPDCQLLVSVGDGPWFGRQRAEDFEAGDDWVASTWSPMQGVRIHTRLEWHPDGHVRRHKIECDFPIHICEGAFAVPRGDEPLHTANEVHGRIKETSIGFASFAFGGLKSGIRSLGEDGRAGELIEPWPNTNSLHPMTVVPVLTGQLDSGTHEICCLVTS